MSRFKKFENNYTVTLFSLILLIFIGYLDYLIGSEVSLLIAYLIPIILISQYRNSQIKLLFINALFASIIWFIVDNNLRHYTNLFNPIWNAFVRFSIFMIIGLLILSLKEKYKKVIQLNEDLKNINEEKNKFIGITAHDLRNPIGAIFSFSNLLLENYSKEIDGRGIKMLTYIKDLSNNSLLLLHDLLDVSKIESGTINLCLKNENYIAFINEQINLNLIIAKKKDINIKLDANESEINFEFDKNYLSTVINNLLTNAIKFSYQNSEIIIKISKTNNQTIKTEIIDEGQGIPENEQSKLFNYFQKTSIQPTNGEVSTGLGLAISKKIVTQHKGIIGVSSEFGKGSNFYFELPLN
ncbi:sensor histidine kinase KdpD [Lutibacter sp.]|uniref:sensor histidine kinase n=1 Tax=Lutibacter sp. TaxID=1925666 RepID=UPI0027337A15|nr:HAMP domain-containing sensor histidine kinase [Lutibacter sp.]MDP3313796.1 HAMP domain-containing sensor histidine kinase [Lutibacter sp.]